MLLGNCLSVGLLCFAVLGACKESDKDGSASKVVVDTEQSEKLAADEDALLGKRDALFNMRQSLQDKRDALASERAEIEKAGGDLTEFNKKVEALAKEEKSLASEESELIRATKALTNERREVVAALSGGAGAANMIASREAGIAGRERQLARRENDVAARESAVSKREEGLADKWKDSCSVGTQTIIRTVDTKGSNYTKRDVEPLLTKARREMSKKGLLKSDLPEQAQGLEKEANDGMKEADYGRARLAAFQLLSTVKSTKINKAFIAAKIARLNQRMGGKRLSKKDEGLFREATANYGDAKFSSANKKLNKIYASLR